MAVLGMVEFGILFFLAVLFYCSEWVEYALCWVYWSVTMRSGGHAAIVFFERSEEKYL